MPLHLTHKTDMIVKKVRQKGRIKMKVEEISFLEWQSRFHDEKACRDALKALKWPDGFICPCCGHHHANFIGTRALYQCGACQHQTSLTAGTLFHRSHLPLQKWFWAIYFMGSDKGGISAVRKSFAKPWGIRIICMHYMTSSRLTTP